MRDGFVFYEKEVKEFLGSRLAKYKIPTRFILYDKLPLLSNGKVDIVGLRRDAIAKTVHK